MKIKRTLYECTHARIKANRIYCDQGYHLSSKSLNGSLQAEHIAKGLVLAPAVCQKCIDFDSMGPPLPEEERGWRHARKVLSRSLNIGETAPETDS